MTIYKHSNNKLRLDLITGQFYQLHKQLFLAWIACGHNGYFLVKIGMLLLLLFIPRHD